MLRENTKTWSSEILISCNKYKYCTCSNLCKDREKTLLWFVFNLILMDRLYKHMLANQT